LDPVGALAGFEPSRSGGPSFCQAAETRRAGRTFPVRPIVPSDRWIRNIGPVTVDRLAFKPQTDDIRESPALTLIDGLLAAGCVVQVHDPEANAATQRLYGDKLTYSDHPYTALPGVDALVVVTDWKEFQRPDLEYMKELMRTPVVFDGRNLYEPAVMQAAGFIYHSIGRQPTMGGRP